jgi:long-subunit acyl-CoA synthetase (AMP-forming)
VCCQAQRFDSAHLNLLHAVPLYDSLGENVVEYIVNHAGVELVFIDVAKLPEFVKATAGSFTCQITMSLLHALSGTAAQLALPTHVHQVSPALQRD